MGEWVACGTSLTYFRLPYSSLPGTLGTVGALALLSIAACADRISAAWGMNCQWVGLGLGLGSGLGLGLGSGLGLAWGMNCEDIESSEVGGER